MKTNWMTGTASAVIAAIAIFAIAFSGVALATETELMTASSSVALSATTMLTLGIAVAIGIGIAMFLRWSMKKGHTLVSPKGSIKAMNAVLVLRMMAVNTRHDYTKCEIATSPKTLVHETNLYVTG
ncbi:hypothetical protein KAW43_02490 [Candidatus Parcubacteria bacterium]|nr:hypothetical protein [Candidatus Parcubacteria bacterium]